MWQMVRTNAHISVGYTQHDIFAGFDRFTLNFHGSVDSSIWPFYNKAAFVQHRVPSIYGEVDDHLFQLPLRSNFTHPKSRP